MPPDITDTLEHIYEAAGYIEVDTAGLTFDAFMADRRTHQVVERNLVIIGEAVDRLRRYAPDLAARVVPKNQFVELGKQMSHGYDRIDYPTVWRVVQEPLPLLRAEVESLLRQAEDR